MNCNRSGLIALLAMAIMIRCTTSEYDRMEREELSKGIRVDTMFLGLRLGMTSNEFFRQCSELNKKHVVRDGLGMRVQYDVTDLNHPASMNFYPDFRNDQIYQMPVIFSYKGWAPWNKDLSSDKLQMDVVKLFEKWYGGNFIEIKHPDKGVAYVKVDGNRRITVFKQDDSTVKVIFRDLLSKD